MPGRPRGDAELAQWTLEETLRIGGEESGPAMLSYVKAIEVDARGNILVYDRTTQDIRVFDPDDVPFVVRLRIDRNTPGTAP